jgi:hypothetical protein
MLVPTFRMRLFTLFFLLFAFLNAACREVGKQRSWPMVERRGESHERANPKSSFDAPGLVSLLDTRQRFQLVK